MRDWDEAVCGICGICPVFESADGNCKSCSPINSQKVSYYFRVSRNTCNLYTNLLQLQWPDLKDTTVTDSFGEVDADSWWSLLECSAIESAIFKDTKPRPFLATDIAPWIPPACRAPVIINTEFQKKNSNSTKLPARS